MNDDLQDYYRLSKILAHRDIPMLDKNGQPIQYSPEAVQVMEERRDHYLQRLRAFRRPGEHENGVRGGQE